MNMLKPPPYCPNALPTANGWVDPKSNELVVYVKNLLLRMQNELPHQFPEKHVGASIPVEVIQEPKAASNTESEHQTSIEQPVRRGRGRPRKYPLPN